MKFSFRRLLVAAVFAFVAVSCNNDDDNNPSLTLELASANTTAIYLSPINGAGYSFTGGMHVAYSTTPNTDENSPYVEVAQGLGSPSVGIFDLQPNTVYYVRLIAFAGNDPVYGTETEVRTMGYTGPGGGIVVLDNGGFGYRYIEVYNQSLTFDADLGVGANWGIPTEVITGLTDNDGPSNTQSIVEAVSGANCAAKLCNDFTNNGLGDWYLPSSMELYNVNISLKGMGIILPERVWTSTAYDDILTTNAALSMKVDAAGTSTFEMYAIDSNASVYAVRHFN